MVEHGHSDHGDHDLGAAAHSHDHAVSAARPDAAEHLGRLRMVLVLVVVFLGVQIVVGFATGSLAVLSDAGHMATDALGIAMSLAAITAAVRSAGVDGFGRRTFGWYRLEILAALANSALLIGVGGFVLFEALRHVAHDDPGEFMSRPVIVIGVVGLAVNLVSMLLLRAGAEDNLNVRGAYLEVVADALGSVAVIVTGVVTAMFGWVWLDAVVGAAIGLFILPRAWRLGGEAVRVLVQAAPAHADPSVVATHLSAIDGVVRVHDLHIWTLTSQMDVVTAHLAIAPGVGHDAVLAAGRRVLAEEFGLDHVTLQVEPAPTAGTTTPECDHPTW